MIILEHKTFNETQCQNPSLDIHDMEEQPLKDKENSTAHPSESKCYQCSSLIQTIKSSI